MTFDEKTRAACARLADMDRAAIIDACVRSLNRGSLASEHRQRLPTEAERERLRRWVGRRLSDIMFIGMAVAGEVDATGVWFKRDEPSFVAFDWEHAPPDWMCPAPPVGEGDLEPKVRDGAQ